MQAHIWSYKSLALFVIFAAAPLYFNFKLIETAKSLYEDREKAQSTPVKPLDSYTFIGSDYPDLLPIPMRRVKMTVEESVHYSLTDPEAYAEWLYTAPLGDHHIRLGPEHRAFVVPMFHELHCLRAIRGALEGGLASLPPARQEHINHCFNYMRQWILCAADVTLEPGDFSQRNFTTERVGATHTCRDWGTIYEKENFEWGEWERFRDSHDLPTEE